MSRFFDRSSSSQSFNFSTSLIQMLGLLTCVVGNAAAASALLRGSSTGVANTGAPSNFQSNSTFGFLDSSGSDYSSSTGTDDTSPGISTGTIVTVILVAIGACACLCWALTQNCKKNSDNEDYYKVPTYKGPNGY